MSKFSFFSTPVADLTVVERQEVGDDRGFLSRLYCAEEFAAAGVPVQIAQINHTLTKGKGTVRGMHYQMPPHAEAKLVTCVRGEVFDVAVDLRKGSPTFLRWHGEVLSPDSQRALYIPEGFAHGFQALSDNCELIYLHTASYSPDAEGGVHALDPKLSIDWKLPVETMSSRDQSFAGIEEDFQGVAL